MKIIFVFVIQLIITFSFAQQKIILTDNNESNYEIIISQNANEDEKTASVILQEYLMKISGVKIPVSVDSKVAGGNEIIIGLTNRSNTPEFNDMKKDLQEDGYRIITIENNIYFIGGSGKGIIYSVTGFLEDYLDCRKYSPTIEYIPKRKNIVIVPTHDVQIPPAKIRIINGVFSNDNNYKYWRKLTTIHDNWDDGSYRGYYVHTFNRLVSKEKYFDKHPEYYSLVNGKRIPYGQLCLSNPEVLGIIKENLGKEVLSHPSIKYWSVSQNDTYENCECENCKAIDKEEGSPSGLLIRLVNEIAKEFPDKIITTLAYQYTRKPPLKTKPLDNVMITLCTIELNRSEPIETDTSSSDFREDIIGWAGITNNIMLWDYEVQFTNYLCPFPLFHTLQPNIQFFTKYGVIAHFQQCNLAPGVEFAELKGYYLSKMLWNPDLDERKIITDFMDGYYREAGRYILEYFDLLHIESKKSNQRLDIYGTPVWNANTYLSKENIAKYNLIFEKAESAVKNEPEILERVKIARLPVIFSELEISKTDLFGERGYYKIQNGKYIIKSEMKKMLEEFYTICKRNNIIHLNESPLEIETYYRNTLRFIDVQVEGNLAFKKPVICNPLPAKKYSGTGPDMLTNGVQGTEDYKINWLGWEDQDCDIIIDLQKKMKINEIILSALQMTKSWILYPVRVTCYLSEDGNNFIEYKSIPTSGDLQKDLDIKYYDFLLSGKETSYIKVFVEGTKKLPKWHNYVGNKSWIFIDEVKVK